MEMQTVLDDHDQKPSNYHSNVDTSLPFRSVKEAVAIFGERFLAGETYPPKPFAFPEQETPRFYTPSQSPRKSQEFPSRGRSADGNDPNLAESLKKLEAELEDTKMELRKLKERESETEVALASLNAELHKNMSKLAQAEATAAAAKTLMASRSSVSIRKDGIVEEEGRRDATVRTESWPTLAQTKLSTGAEKEDRLEANFKKLESKVKKKPIIPLVGNLFSRKKGSSTSVMNPVYASSQLRLN